MGLALLATLLLATGCTGAGVSGSAGSGVLTNTISVTGTGTALGAPDVAYVDLGVDMVSGNVGQAVSESNRTMNKVIDAIVQAGIAKEDIQTIGFSVYPEDRTDPQTGQPTGERVYHAQNLVHITVRDIAADDTKVGKVIDAGLAAGANSVQSVSFGVLDTSALEAEARTKAIADAKNRAQQLAEGLGVTLGKPTIISESMGGIPMWETAAFAGGKGGGGTPISAGQLTVSLQVNVTFTITP